MNNGKITISRVHSNVEEDYIEITMVDEKSGIPFLEVKIDMKSFGLLVTGCSYMPCQFLTRGLERIGLKREYKTVQFKCKEYPKDSQKRAILKEARKLEIDGWILCNPDLDNHHKWRIEENEYSIQIGFIRYVKESNGKEDNN